MRARAAAEDMAAARKAAQAETSKSKPSILLTGKKSGEGRDTWNISTLP